MATKRILVTGGAGFIGSHLVDVLTAQGHAVRVFDNLDPQVHGPDKDVPEYIAEGAEFVKGDVRNIDELQQAMADIDVVFHLAARVGVGQSMYEVPQYIHVNEVGTANLWQVLIDDKDRAVEKIIVASSNTIYGEGLGYCTSCGAFAERAERREEDLASGTWEVRCPQCGEMLDPRPTPETKSPHATSVYALNKLSQETLTIMLGQTYGIPAVATRFFCVYGPRQSLSNPYTGVFAIFASRVLAGQAPTIFEDGQQTRDFVHVLDIVQGLVKSMESPEANGQIFNIGTGNPVKVTEVSDAIIGHFGTDFQAEITGQFRKGDIRHCFADISKARSLLGYEPQYSFSGGITTFLDWVEEHRPSAQDKFAQSRDELKRRGLLV
jgi:dTDP-L-rhamnose 4-epimerase